ncbi:MAG: 30S ribosomal protein S21 [Nitrospirae bacterium]|nr:30S ribosomal protein S21 [Nitrospirota bacterium]
MPFVKIGEKESFENALKKFKRQCEKEGILSEIKKREHYDKPSIKKKKKSIAASAARKKSIKKTRTFSGR